MRGTAGVYSTDLKMDKTKILKAELLTQLGGMAALVSRKLPEASPPYYMFCRFNEVPPLPVPFEEGKDVDSA